MKEINNKERQIGSDNTIFIASNYYHNGINYKLDQIRIRIGLREYVYARGFTVTSYPELVKIYRLNGLIINPDRQTTTILLEDTDERVHQATFRYDKNPARIVFKKLNLQAS